MRSSNDAQHNGPRSADLYGLPSCHPFNPHAAPAEFLSSYHTCLTAGCAVRVDSDKIIQMLLQAGSSLTYPYNVQYISMVHSGLIRPDNYVEMLAQIQSRPPTTYGFGVGGSSVTGSGTGGSLPYSLNLGGQSGSTSGNSANAPDTSDHRFFGANGLQGLPGFGGSASPLSIFPFPTQDPCPFRPQQFYQPGLPVLSGSFAGCCEKPLCYLPKQDLHNAYSGISPYLSEWSSFGDCSASCGGGVRNRTRTCIRSNYCGALPQDYNCPTNALMIQTQVCNPHVCPHWSSWGAWSDCTASCGGGIRHRSRVCNGVGVCPGNKDDREYCRTGQCPTFVDGPWSDCSNTCGRGMRTRTRSCTHGGAYGCPADTIDQAPCRQFCGVSTITCNPTSCCYEQTCAQSDGSPGHCQEDYRVGTACSTGFCYWRPAHQRCNNGGSYPNSFNFQG